MGNSYSDWLKIDLHIHTDKSKDTKEGDYNGTFSIDVLKAKLKENGVEIFSLTDHNIINVEAYRKYYSNYNKDEDPLLLLGIEFDIKGSDKNYHSLLIFNKNSTEDVSLISEKIEKKFQDKGVNFKERFVSFEDIVELFRQDDFFFIPHASYGGPQNIISGTRSTLFNTQRMLILMQSALEKVTKEETIEHYNSGFNDLLSEEFQNRKDIAYINFSDNHCCDKYPKSHFGENDFSLYFIKGIKSFESIRLAFIDPESRIKSPEEFQKIDKTNNVIEKISIEQNWELETKELYFSPHLNAIIGGRSSGKSLLMWMIGKKIDGVSSGKNYGEVSLEKIKLKTKNDSEEKDIVSLNNAFLYLEQGDIIKYFEEKKLNELAEKAGKKEEYDSARKAIIEKKNELDFRINSLVDAYEKAYNDNKSRFVIPQRIIDNITNNDVGVVCFNMSTINNNQYVQTNELLKNTLESLTKIRENELLEISDDELVVLDNAIKLIKNKMILMNKAIVKINQKNRFIGLINEIVNVANASLSENAQQKAKDKDTLKALVTAIGTKISSIYNLKKHSDNLECFECKDEKKILIDDINLVIRINSDTSIKDLILDGINSSNNSRSLFGNLCYLLDLRKENIVLKNYRDKSPDNLRKKINSQLSELIQCIENPVDYLQYIDGTNSFGKSPGFNSEQYLKIVLNNPEIKIVFIDQPEDNLGNQFISDELVKQIRNIKYNKQIFLVTHNPSIVIYGDAECIILAENNQNKITYKQLFLEDKTSQETICKVLDGGKYIFNNRAQKYNIHRLK